jgi:hypothetical protein
MSPKDRVVTFRPDDDLLKGMAALRERDGMPFSEQVRRALRVFLTDKGVMEKTASRRASTRRKT